MRPALIPVARAALLRPVVLLIELALLVVSPVLLALAAVASLFDRRRRPLRLTWLIAVYLLFELRATVVAFWLWLRARVGRGMSDTEVRERHYILMRDFLGKLYAQGERAIAFRLELEGSREATELLARRRRPVIVAARHQGFGDSFLLVHELLSHFDRSPRIVMKSALQLAPVIDIFGNRLPNCFVGGDRDDVVRAIRQLADGLRDDGALLIFPEGANFSFERRRHIIASLLRRGERGRAKHALALHNVVVPQTAGLAAALAGAPGADLVLVGHSGLPPVSLGGVWRSIPLERPVRMRLWSIPAEEVERDEDRLEPWLMEHWKELDIWLTGQPPA